MKYGVWLDVHFDCQLTRIEEIDGQIYSRNTLGEFKVPRLREEFLDFIPESLITDYIAKINSSKINDCNHVYETIADYPSPYSVYSARCVYCSYEPHTSEGK